MKKALLLAAVLAALLVSAVVVVRMAGPHPAAQTVEALPWQVQTLPGGASRVFGFVLAPAGGSASAAAFQTAAASSPASARGSKADAAFASSAPVPAPASAMQPAAHLADLAAAFGEGLQLALIARDDEPGGTLEAYVDGLTAGFVTGKLIAVADLDAATAQRLRDQAVEREPLPSGARRYTLRPADRQQALRAPLRGLSFLPSLRLDATMVLQRFGPPAERRSVGGQLHLLYPAQGLVVSLEGSGAEPARAVIQYVAPARFDLLRGPLTAPAAASAGAS